MSTSRKNHSINILIYLCLFSLLFSGCAGQQYGAVEFSSTPSGAEVINLKDDTVLGSTPVRVLWKGDAGSSEKVVVQFKKSGFYEKISSIWVNKRHDSRQNAENDAVQIHAELIKYK